MEELQGAVIVALAACPDVGISLSETTAVFRFRSERGVELFMNGITYFSRLNAVVIDTEVIVTYVD